MRRSMWQGIAGVFLAVILAMPMWGTTNRNPAVPGTLNYVEGQASIGNQTLDAQSIGSTELQTGQSIQTQNGKAEVLLTPGVFLRIGDNSSVKMLSPSLTYTEVDLTRGQAMVEVAEIMPQNDLRVVEDGAATQLLKTGLYGFDANTRQVRVFDGQAMVLQGDQQVRVKGSHEVTLDTTGKLKARKFDKDAYEQSDLYRFSSLRSSYLAEANTNEARIYVANGWYGPGWIGAGWYWDPWFDAYTFIPGDGIFYSPFGWGFYSPLWVYRAPVFYRGPFVHHFSPAYHPPAFAHVGHFRARGPMSQPHFAAPRGGMHAIGGFHGQGFGGGGFHGSNFGPGRH
jgi:FecR protein